MNLNPFRASGSRRQTPRQLRQENERLTRELAEANELLDAHDKLLSDLVEQRDWFHDHWVTAGEHAAEAEIVVACLTKQLEAERRKVADLEAIAGPHTPAADTDSPIYTEVTAEHPLPEFAEPSPAPDFTANPDVEDTVQIPLVKTLADALVDA